VSDGGYQALSYVWGSPDKHFAAIVLDEMGHELGYIPLTMNLQTALCDLRDAEGVTNKLFWIDQLCIDQEGKEKTSQVAMMGQIYRNAARVITYLGPAVVDNEEEQRGIVLLYRLYEHFYDNYDMLYEINGLEKAYSMKAKFPVQNVPNEIRGDAEFDGEIFVAPGWRWLLQQAYGEWTQRLWLVQEQFLNKEVVMLHGLSLLSWDAVVTMALLFDLYMLPLSYREVFGRQHLSASGKDLLRIEMSIYGLWHTRKMQEKAGWSYVGKPLLTTMAHYQFCECWDYRDRVFALLAISSNAIQLAIVPDYSISSDRVFFDASVRILLAGPDLKLLVYACKWAGSNRSSNDQSEIRDSTFLTPSWALRPPPIFSTPLNIEFDICTPHPRTWPSCLNIKSSILVLKGHLVDRISMSTTSFFVPQNFGVKCLS